MLHESTSFNYIFQQDARVKRQVQFVSGDYSVVTAGNGNPNIDGVEYIDCLPSRYPALQKVIGSLLLLFKFHEAFYWRSKHIKDAYNKLKNEQFDLVIANDFDALPLAVRLAGNQKKVIWDAHEYSPKQVGNDWKWRLIVQPFREYMCKKYIPQLNGMMTVCQGIADEYHKNFGGMSIIVTNAPNYQKLAPQKTDYNNIKLIHHGQVSPSRKLEITIDMMNHLDDRFSLDLYLMLAGKEDYLDWLKEKAKGNKRINFLPGMKPEEIPKIINQYDIGVFILPPTSFNYRFALPNKFFEFIQARLAVAIGPSPEMARIIKENNNGIIADNFEAKTMAGLLNQLSAEDIDKFKSRSDSIAWETSSEKNKEKMLAMINQLLS